MFHKEYSNFVKPVLQESPESYSNLRDVTYKLKGEEAKRLYLEELKDVKVNENPDVSETNTCHISKNATDTCIKRKLNEIDTNNTNLYLSVQNNDVTTLKKVLDAHPEKISSVDEFGWSLLMIACQANSVEAVKELLNRGIDTSVRDKAGNSARTLVIKNKNLVLADILLNANHYEPKPTIKAHKVRLKEEYSCEICNNKVFADKQEHLSSTLHNINASKGKKIPAKFTIPSSNIGYQIMLKEGWDKESGLGRDGRGKKYPVKVIQKLDRKGLGLKNKKTSNTKEKESYNSRAKRDYHENRRFEVNFRREFY